MIPTKQMSRRAALGSLVGAAGALATTSAFAGAFKAACGLTPAQTEGPFYPVEDQLDKDADLTQVQGRTGRALGPVIYMQGQVTDERCLPVAGVLVEIWQACASGRYNHPGDTNTAPLDPDFQYWGQALTDAQGNYRFKTVLPGAYPADTDWIRPPHIHYKAHKKGYHELTTQLYFEGNEYNAGDRILNAVPAAERAQVITALIDAGPGFEAGSRLGRFDLSIRRVT